MASGKLASIIATRNSEVEFDDERLIALLRVR
jgi:hypothetical protein